MLVVPDHEERQLTPKLIALIRNNQLSRALALDRSNQPLDDGDAPVLANRTEPLADAAATAPCSEFAIGELRALIRDEMSRLDFGSPHGSSEEGPDCRGRRLMLEDGEAMILRE